MGEELQRARIERAMAEEMAARADPHAVSVADVVARAGVSRRAFHEFYADREDCFLGAFERGLALAGGEMYAAYSREARWADGVRGALAALLLLLDREPALARLCIVYALGGGARVQARRLAAIEVLCEYVDRGRLEGAGRSDPPEVAAEGVVGAVLAVLHTRLLSGAPGVGSEAGVGSDAGVGGEDGVGGDARVGGDAWVGGQDGVGGHRTQRPIELLGPLMHVILLPYVGAARAGRELSRRVPRAPGGGAEAGDDGPPDGPEGGLGVRLTYRTARVLHAIGERPRASNREVADQAGIVDQGQISRLLRRLESLGLVVNVGDAAGGNSTRGTANAWVLTPRGFAASARAPAASPSAPTVRSSRRPRA